MQKYSLQPQHKTRFEEWTRQWIENGMSTKPMDEAERELCRRAVEGMYALVASLVASLVAAAVADGTALFAVHGVRGPAWIILHPNRITVDKIQSEPNAEIRRVMIDKYGQSRYLQDSKAEMVHKDDWGELYRSVLRNDEPLVMVKVLNATPESDGSFKDYWLRTHPELKPLPPGEWSAERKREWLDKQEPQQMTARNAVASTFGLRGQDYDPVLET